GVVPLVLPLAIDQQSHFRSPSRLARGAGDHAGDDAGFMPAPRAARVESAEQLVGGFGDQLALEAGAGEFVRRGLARAVAAGNGRGSVGAATGNLVEGHLALEAVGQA